MEEETKKTCVICNKEFYKMVGIPKGLSMAMFGIEDGKVPVCKECYNKQEVCILMRYALGTK